MSRFNTGNPLGSGSPLDLDDNAKNMDLAVNAQQDTFQDRLGKSRLTWAGMESGFGAGQVSREQRFRTFIASSGYQFVGDYAPGIEITEYNQLIRDSNGEFWRVSGQVDLPYITTGAGIPEDDALVPAGDAVLRQDLANPDMGALIVAWERMSFQSIAEHSIGNALSSKAVSPWEFARLVVGKPDPQNPSTWDWAPALEAALRSGWDVYLPSQSFRIASPVVSNIKSRLYSDGGEILIDYEALGSGVEAITFNGEGSHVEGVVFNPVNPSGYIEDSGASCLRFNADNCKAINNIGNYHPRFIYATGDDHRFTAIGNRGDGYFDGLTMDSRNHHFIEVNNGEQCVVDYNYGRGWAQVVVVGGSTNRSSFCRNVGIDCGDHVVYLSSGSFNEVCGNIGSGKYTSIKARGDGNTVDGNIVVGGILSYTNAIADGTETMLGDFLGSRAGSCSGNTVVSARNGASAIMVGQRSSTGPTDFNVTLRGLRVQNNTARGFSDSERPLQGILISAYGVDGMTLTGNIVANVEGDGILATPLPFTPENYTGIVCTGNVVEDCGAEGIQITGGHLVILGNIVRRTNRISVGGSAGGIVLSSVTDSVVALNNVNSVRVAGTGPAILETGVSDRNLIVHNRMSEASARIVTTGASTIVEDVVQAEGAGFSGTVPANAQTQANIVVPGARVGDYVEISPSVNLSGVIVQGFVTSSGSGNVRVYYSNVTASPVSIAAHSVKIRVSRR